MRPGPIDREGTPRRCPHCGSERLGPVRPADIEVAPLDPDRAPDAHPGMLACKDCQAVVRWGP